MMTAMLGPLDGLSDDILAHVVLFLDFESAVTFTKATYPALTDRFASDSYRHVWRSIYARHGFAPLESSSQDIIVECRERRKLVHNLVGTKKMRHCFNLPNRLFYFVPVVPIDHDEEEWNDAPPVDFDCNSFVLTSPGVSGEFIFLDPFDMSLSIHNHCTDNAVASDEAMMTQAMMNAASAVVRRANNTERDEHIAGAVIDETIYRNHNVQEYRTPPSQVLIDAQDYFDVNLTEYFDVTDDRHAVRRTPQGILVLHPNDEVDFGYIGIEAKPIVGEDGQLVGTMIGLGRLLCSLHVDGDIFADNVACTEIVTWRKMKGEALYSHIRVCRVPWDIYCADTCARNNRMYVVYYRGQGPLPRVPQDDAMDDTGSLLGRKTIMAYPLVAADDTAATAPRYFPQPEFHIVASDFVSYVTVDCTGTLLVGTNNGTIEVWKPDTRSGLVRVALMKSKEAVIASAKRLKADTETVASIDDRMVGEDELDSDGEHVSACIDDMHGVLTETDIQLALPSYLDSNGILDDSSVVSSASVDEEQGEDETNVDMDQAPAEPMIIEDDEDELPRIHDSPSVDSFCFASHLSIEDRGFLSLQHNRVEGASLLLWKQVSTDIGHDILQVVSQINLPLSPPRKPRVHFDGRRIVVLGEDHIGVIILVYQVFSSTEDIDFFPSNLEKKLGDESGGVYNYTIRPHVRFANRIRHAALGGVERFEGIYMTCNERFIIVNTKTGNLLGGGSSITGDGLLVIDLKDHD